MCSEIFWGFPFPWGPGLGVSGPPLKIFLFLILKRAGFFWVAFLRHGWTERTLPRDAEPRKGWQRSDNLKEQMLSLFHRGSPVTHMAPDLQKKPCGEMGRPALLACSIFYSARKELGCGKGNPSPNPDWLDKKSNKLPTPRGEERERALLVLSRGLPGFSASAHKIH